MERRTKRSSEEIKQLLSGYEQSGLSRRQYCEQQGVAITTFDYYRQRHRKGPRASQRATPLVRVKLKDSAPLNADERRGFTIVLAKGRRIEGNWSYNEQDLTGLIRVVEAA